MSDSTKVSTDIDTPAGYNGGNAPGNAMSLPTKSYPQNNKGMKKTGGDSIEGPCTGKEY